jgi:hypothetical protein
MANTSRVNGFRPVKHLNGAPYNGKAGIYEVPAGEAIPVFVGDLVVLSGSAATSYFPAVEAPVTAAATSGAFVGAVVGILNAKMDPVSGTMTAGSISLDTPQYRAASTKQFVLVADEPGLVFEAEADAAVALASVGLNVGVVEGDGSASLGSTTTGASGMQVDASSVNTTSTLPLQIVGFPNRVDNEPNATYNKVWVRINTHAYGNVGVAGV